LSRRYATPVAHTEVRAVIRAHAGTGQLDFRAEPDCLIASPLGELRTAYTVWKSQIVFDLRSAAGLSTDGPALHQHRAQSLGCTVDRGAQTGRPGAIDREIVF
jgi:hypothetical protein